MTFEAILVRMIEKDHKQSIKSSRNLQRTEVYKTTYRPTVFFRSILLETI
jgi:hypothetical protein